MRRSLYIIPGFTISSIPTAGQSSSDIWSHLSAWLWLEIRMLGICGKTQASYIGRIPLELQRMNRSCTRHRRRWTRRRNRCRGRYQPRSTLSSSCGAIDIGVWGFIGKKYRCSYCKRTHESSIQLQSPPQKQLVFRLHPVLP